MTLAEVSYNQSLPPVERLHEVFDYDPLRGALIWRARTSNRTKIGSIAGFVNKLGYTEVRVDGRLFLAHRLIWKWVHGVDPSAEINHIGQEGIKPKRNHVHLLADVSARDHRVLTSQINKRSGLPAGVSRCSRYKAYFSAITLNGVRVHLGTYDTPEEAAAAYRGASKLINSL